jgi:hypothetical protein
MHCTVSAKSTLDVNPRLFSGIKGKISVSVWFFVTFACLLFIYPGTYWLALKYTWFFGIASAF